LGLVSSPSLGIPGALSPGSQIPLGARVDGILTAMALATLADAGVQGVATSAACPAFFSNRSCSSGIGRF